MTEIDQAAHEFLERARRELRDLEADDRLLEAQELGVKRRRAELATEINAIRASIQTYRRLMGLSEEAEPSRGLFDKPTPHGTIGDMAQAIMEQHGGHMKVADVTRALEEVGKLSHGGGGTSARGNYGTVYGTLSRDRRFVKVGEGEFALAQENKDGDDEGDAPTSWRAVQENIRRLAQETGPSIKFPEVKLPAD